MHAPPPPLKHAAQSVGPLISYKLKPAAGWKVVNEASLNARTLYSSVTYKAQGGE
jgi:hypothetical protein